MLNCCSLSLQYNCDGVFIDDFHSTVGCYSGGEQGMGSSNMGYQLYRRGLDIWNNSDRRREYQDIMKKCGDGEVADKIK